MDVVRAGELHAPPQRVEEAAPLDERRRNCETEEREPRDRHEVDSREVAEEPCQADRQEREEAGSQRNDDVTTAPDGLHERNRADVRRGKDERADQDIEDHSRYSVQLAVCHAEDPRPDAKGKRGPEASAVELQCLSDELPDGAGLGGKRRR